MKHRRILNSRPRPGKRQFPVLAGRADLRKTSSCFFYGLALALPTSGYSQGFAISLDGDVISGDTEVAAIAETVAAPSRQADIAITQNPLDPIRNLDFKIRPAADGWHIQTINNYPQFSKRGELRFYRTINDDVLVSTHAVDPNSDVHVSIPTDARYIAYRVYDARGRYDETVATALDTIGTTEHTRNPEKTQLHRTNIPVRGVEVIVSANGIGQDNSLVALGEVILPDENGNVEIKRILPSGSYWVQADIVGTHTQYGLTQAVDVDSSRWFYVLVADAEFQQRNFAGRSNWDQSLNIQGFVDGETDSGIAVTASVDADDATLEEFFSRIYEKDPQTLARRMAESQAHLIYGDDSELRDATPTSGRLYLKLARDGNEFLFGDYSADLEGSYFLKNARNLFGIRTHVETPTLTKSNEARASLDLYAAQPTERSIREEFLGTAGSFYHLEQQDITPGSETLYIETRDQFSGRVINRTPLREGTDYEINYFQGVVTLNSPLFARTETELLENQRGGDSAVYLTAQYEYEPIGLDVDGTAFGGRAEAWVTDTLRVGATAATDQSRPTDRDERGIDLRWQAGDQSYVQVDLAQSKGPAVDRILSIDGGLTSDPLDNSDSGDGNAARIEGEFHAREFGFDSTLIIGGYSEIRETGFSTNENAPSGPDGTWRNYGIYATGALTETVRIETEVDRLDTQFGADKTQAEIIGGYRLNDKWDFQIGIGHIAESLGSERNDRSDIALGVDYTPSEATSLYAFAQTKIAGTGVETNNRIGVGGRHQVSETVSLEGEVSYSSTGLGGRLGIERRNDDVTIQYMRIESDTGTRQGDFSRRDETPKLVLGAQQRVGENLTLTGETRMDLLSDRDEQMNYLGFTYIVNDGLQLGAQASFGQVQGGEQTIERRAVSFDIGYNEGKLDTRLRLEYRNDDNTDSTDTATASDTDSFVVAGNAQWKIDTSQRLLFDLLWSNTDADTTSLLGGTYREIAFGYAYRPVENETMNALATLRWIDDQFGQELDDEIGEGYLQRSAIADFQVNYDLNSAWTMGAKLGVRLSRAAVNQDAEYFDNDAWLGILNFRYHMNKKWDGLVELRHFDAVDTDYQETGALLAIYRQINKNVSVGAGYNFTEFSDDLADLSLDERGAFFNIVVAY